VALAGKSSRYFNSRMMTVFSIDIGIFRLRCVLQCDHILSLTLIVHLATLLMKAGPIQAGELPQHDGHQ
jgi:hypothetical protein